MALNLGRLFCCVICLSLVMSSNEPLFDSPITYTMKYNQFMRLGANWSYTSRYSDYSTEYPVVDYSQYAADFDQFRDKYPFFTIETTGQAIAECCFGDVGKGHFGRLEFETIYFNHSNWNNKYAVYSHLNGDGFNVGAEIGFGFRKVGNHLYLRPFINGWIYSAGYLWRCLHFGLGVTSITFHPSKTEYIFVELKNSL